MYRIDQKTGGERSTPTGRQGAWTARLARRTATTALVACTFFAGGDALAATQHFGTWLNDEGKAKIELRECGGDALCSEIVWLKDPVDENGRPWRDELNPNPQLNNRPIIGLDVLVEAKKVGPRTWSGQIYDPEKGETFYLKYIKVGRDQVEIRGCLSAGWPCRSKYWTRTTPVRQREETREVKRRAPTSPQTPKQAAIAHVPGITNKTHDQRETEAPKHTTRVQPPPVPQRAPELQQQKAPQQQAIARAPSVDLPSRKPAPPTASPAPSAVLPWNSRMARAAEVPPAPAFAPPPAATAAFPRPTPAGPPQSTPDGESVYLVQVTAGQDHTEALRLFGNLQRRFPDLLGGFLPNIQKVDLGPKGIWYRVRVGPIGEHMVAVSFCEQLKAAGGDCLIRKD